MGRAVKWPILDLLYSYAFCIHKVGETLMQFYDKHIVEASINVCDGYCCCSGSAGSNANGL